VSPAGVADDGGDDRAAHEQDDHAERDQHRDLHPVGAIDIETKVLSAKGKTVRLGAKNRKLWLATAPWIHAWLGEHCSAHGFAPYEKEPWHWNFVGTLQGAAHAPAEDSRC